MSKLDLLSPMAPTAINLKSDLDRLSVTQTFNKSVSAFSHPVVNNGGFYTTNSSAAHQKQQEVMGENRQNVYQNALTRYKELLEKGESAKKAFLDSQAQ